MPKKILLDLKNLASKPLSHASAMPKEIYTSDKILDLEDALIFSKEWICAGRETEIPNVGDYFIITWQSNHKHKSQNYNIYYSLYNKNDVINPISNEIAVDTVLDGETTSKTCNLYPKIVELENNCFLKY